MTPRISGVRFVSLRRIDDERGSVMHMLKSTDDWFVGFGEVYFSTILPGAVKAWRRHRRMVTNIAVPVGEVTIAVFNDDTAQSADSQFAEFQVGDSNFGLLIISPLVWYSFCNTGNVTCVIANCASLPHNPREVERGELTDEYFPRISFGRTQ